MYFGDVYNILSSFYHLFYENVPIITITFNTIIIIIISFNVNFQIPFV